ncbi:MAG: serine hydrolase [Acidobacteria bacterium]|nr:serine hydrolase [Acidobacteriota bacterium]MBV9146981.1 serine hydrolase [Acidobacteriota bacterium]MBV9437527.1 serine hydrolase [Acidobacteriota bacterium]
MKPALFLLLACCGTVFAATDTNLQTRIAEMSSHHQGKISVYAANLKTGQTLAVDADQVVPTASVIKLPILVEAMREVKAGKRSLEEKVTLDKDNVVPGSGVFHFFDLPLTVTFKDALTFMIIETDNTATNMVIDQVGIKNVNDNITAMGLKDTYLYKKVYKPATGPMPADQKKFGLGKTTAREMGRVMESIVNCDLHEQKLCDAMLYMLRNQQVRNMIPHYIETSDTSEGLSLIGNKTGSLDEVRNDVAVVYSKAGPLVISVFTSDNQDKSWTNDNAAELLIGHLAKAIVEAWSPQGLGKDSPNATTAP